MTLKRRHVDELLAELIPSPAGAAIQYKMGDFSVKVSILKLGEQYFAKLNSCFLAELEDKKSFIKKAVEFALKQQGLSVDFKQLAVGGVISSEGRMTAVASFFGLKVRYHAFTLFKTAGEDEVSIEDPRTGVFERKDKFQSRFNDQICGFAATALLFSSYKALEKTPQAQPPTEVLFAVAYKRTDLKAFLQGLEKKVGHEATTREAVLADFPTQLKNLEQSAALAEPVEVEPLPAPPFG